MAEFDIDVWHLHEDQLVVNRVLQLISEGAGDDPFVVAAAYDLALPNENSWRSAKRALRTYLIWCSVAAVNSSHWPDVEEVLTAVFGGVRFGRRGWDVDLRSQLRKAYDLANHFLCHVLCSFS